MDRGQPNRTRRSKTRRAKTPQARPPPPRSRPSSGLPRLGSLEDSRPDAADPAGGRVLIYNLSPATAPPGKPYIPAADGRSPFARATWEKAGFRVLAFDQDDSGAARALGRALGWDRLSEQPMDLVTDLFATYTLAEKPAAGGRR